MRKAHEVPASVLHKYLLARERGFSLIAFVEGKDDLMFYRYIFRLESAQEPEFVICGNKRSVYAAYPLIESRRNNDLRLYFVDKDLDDLAQHWDPPLDRLHVTDFYSIESYVSTREGFRVFWNDWVRFRGKDEISADLLMNKFIAAQEAFRNVVRPLMAWALAARRCGLYPVLADVKMEKFVRLNDDLEPVLITEPIDLANLCPLGDTPPDNFADLVQSAEKELACLEPRLYVRGKFDFWFVRNFALALLQSLRDRLRTKIPDPGHTELLLAMLQSVTRECDVAEFLRIHLDASVS